MRAPSLAFLAAALLADPGLSYAQAPRDSVVAVVNEFFRAMTARDTAALARIQVSGSMHYAVRRAETVTYRERSGTAWLRQLADSRDTLVERMWDPTVMVHGPLAILWAPYDIYRNGEFVHCGVDAFTLVRTQAGWQITAVAYTMEPTGCAPSPLGPLRASPR
ncbi:MAG: hypothetical protein Q8Q85_16140 [Gemmatimonadales bacterium]|nr:hypothetical protein [Gemmatimonadales bacterium]